MASHEYEAIQNDLQRRATIEGIPRIEAKLDAVLAKLGVEWPPGGGSDRETPPAVSETRPDDDEGGLLGLDLDGGTMAALEEAGIDTEWELREAIGSGEEIAGVGEARRKKIRKALGLPEE